MRYHFNQSQRRSSRYGLRYICNHPVYNVCTLFIIGDIGLSVIQQRFDPTTKFTWWGEIDSCLTDELYLHPNFKKYFDANAGKKQGELYPTVTIRQIMWGLKMKPLKRERWETTFDHRNI